MFPKRELFLKKTTKSARITRYCSGHPRFVGYPPGCFPAPSASPGSWLASGFGAFGVEMAVAAIMAWWVWKMMVGRKLSFWGVALSFSYLSCLSVCLLLLRRLLVAGMPHKQNRYRPSISKPKVQYAVCACSQWKRASIGSSVAGNWLPRDLLHRHHTWMWMGSHSIPHCRGGPWSWCSNAR